MLYACIALLLPAAAANAGLGVAVGVSGEVNITVDGSLWLASGDHIKLTYGSSTLSAADGSLTLRKHGYTTSGSDALGKYTAHSWDWKSNKWKGCSPDGTILTTEVRTYESLTDSVIFRQVFPCGYKLSTTNRLATDFPYFVPSGFENSAVFNGHFGSDTSINLNDGKLSKCSVDTQGGPVMMYDNTAARVLVASMLTRIKTADMYCTDHLSFGLKGTLSEIPAGFDASWVLSLGTGVTDAMEKWGDVLLKKSGKARRGPYNDEIVSGLGWWTDNGGYYHYGGTDGKAGGYQRAMFAMQDYIKKLEVPFRHWQLDSWWYPKGAGGSGSSQNSKLGDYKWVADDFVFPDGVPALQTKVGLPFVMHNRWYQPGESWYQKNGIGGSKWAETSKNTASNHACAVPLDQDAFWSYFFTQQEGYGLATYEQDFMYTQYDSIPAMQENATLADDWLHFMAKHAAKANLTMQYCMPHAREFLASTQFENVVTIRASGDYAAGGDNWKISKPSLLAHAVGLLPFKDTFLSNDGPEEGGASRARGPEPHPDLQLIVSVLSASIVGPGDGINYLNKTRLMTSCRADGLVLKADRVAVPLDVHWTDKDPGGEVVWAPSSIGGNIVTRYLLSADLSSNYAMGLNEIGLAQADTILAYNWFTKELRRVAGSSVLELTSKAAFEYWVLAPKVGSWFLLGDTSKIVTNSIKRLKSVQAIGDSLQVTVIGTPHEQIHLCAVGDHQHLTISCEQVTLTVAGQGIVTFSAASDVVI